MSGVIVTLDPGSQPIADAETALQHAMEEAPEEECNREEREVPETWTTNDYVCMRYFLDEQAEVREIDPPGVRILTINYNDTVDCATGYFFERLDGRWYRTDTYTEPEGSYGDRLRKYFQSGYGVEGVVPV
ncbi:MAG: hypothetical protein V5A41_04190 [Haloarculaceae archaeon]